MRTLLQTSVATALTLASFLGTADAQSFRVYFGNYTRPPEGGIFQATFDAATGKLSEATLAGPATNASFLAIHPTHKYLFAVGEISDFEGKKTGGVSAFAIDPNSGNLTLLNAQSSAGPGPCHITLDRQGKTALVANYGGGSVASLPIGDDGKLAPAASAIQHTGSSVNASRQKEPHAHSINLDPANGFAFAADLGLDKVLIYKFNPASHTITPHDPAAGVVPPGSGPRHFAFHPSARFAYVINELANTITAFAFDAAAGRLTPIQNISTVPSDFTGNSYTAEVVAHPNGKFLYGSNRGHDTIAVFQVDAQSGQLTAAGHTPIGGKTPRNFAIDPTGRWLLVGCQGTNNVTVFSINAETGALTPTGQSIATPSPVCIRFLPL